MNESLTAVIERNATLDREFVTEPYEVAWAREARWFFVPIEPTAPDRQLTVTTEVSPDGLSWCPLEPEDMRLPGDRTSTWVSREFGGWLRLHGRVDSGAVRGSLYLTLKA